MSSDAQARRLWVALHNLLIVIDGAVETRGGVDVVPLDYMRATLAAAQAVEKEYQGDAKKTP